MIDRFGTLDGTETLLILGSGVCFINHKSYNGKRFVNLRGSKLAKPGEVKEIKEAKEATAHAPTTDCQMMTLFT